MRFYPCLHLLIASDNNINFYNGYVNENSYPSPTFVRGLCSSGKG